MPLQVLRASPPPQEAMAIPPLVLREVPAALAVGPMQRVRGVLAATALHAEAAEAAAEVRPSAHKHRAQAHWAAMVVLGSSRDIEKGKLSYA